MGEIAHEDDDFTASVVWRIHTGLGSRRGASWSPL